MSINEVIFLETKKKNRKKFILANFIREKYFFHAYEVALHIFSPFSHLGTVRSREKYHEMGSYYVFVLFLLSDDAGSFFRIVQRKPVKKYSSLSFILDLAKE